MADVLEIPNKYKRQVQREIIKLKAYQKWYSMAWFAICELIYLHKRGK
jgi:hypothetical protein